MASSEAPTTTGTSPSAPASPVIAPAGMTPVSAAAIASAGRTVRSNRLRALRVTDGSTTVQPPRNLMTGAAARASSSISSSVRGSPCNAICHLKAKSLSVASAPSWSSPSRVAAPARPCEATRSSTVLAVRSRPRLRGHNTSTPRSRSAATPSASRLDSSSASRVI